MQKAKDKTTLVILVFMLLTSVIGCLGTAMLNFSDAYFNSSNTGNTGLASLFGNQLLSFGISLIFMALLCLFIYFVKLSYVIKASPAVYAIAIIIIFIALSQSENDLGIYNRFFLVDGLSIYIPSLFYFAVFLMAYLTSKYSTYNVKYILAMWISSVFIPFLMSFISLGIAQGTVLFVSFYFLTVKLTKDNRLEKKYLKYTNVIIAACAVLFLFALFKDKYFVDRIHSMLIRDPNDYFGMLMTEFHNALDTVKLIGRSTYNVILDNSNHVPANIFFARKVFTSLDFILFNYGWIPFAAVLLMPLIISVATFFVSEKANNTYVKYYTFTIAVLFAVRTLLSFLLQFFFPALNLLREINFPFMGGLSAATTDCILVLFALVINKKSNKEFYDELDLENKEFAFFNINSDFKKRITDWINAADYIDDNDADPSELDISAKRNAPDFIPSDSGKQKEGHFQSHIDTDNQSDTFTDSMDADSQESNSFIDSLCAKDKKLAFNATEQNLEKEHIFISFNHRDLKYAESLAGQLEKMGAKTWYYTRDSDCGYFPDYIIKAIKKAKIFVVILTSFSNASNFICSEVGVAFKDLPNGIILMPILLEDISLNNQLYLYLINQNITDAIKPPKEKQIESFAKKVYNKYNELDKSNDNLIYQR